MYLTIPTIKGFREGSGPLLSPKDNIRKSFEFVGVTHTHNLYDLGMGTGRALLIAGKEFGANVYGLEMSPILFFIAKISLYFHGINKCKLYRKDYNKYCIGDADAVYCFLSPRKMVKLKNKFEKELHRGAWVISYCFPIEDWEPVKVFDFDNPGKMYIYKIV